MDLTEVDEVLGNRPYVRRGRDALYYVLGQTEAGRYLLIVLRDLGAGRARVVTAREMTPPERRAYQRR
ncbi:hypothetical protein LLH23_04190 [bacterium]|nr:hypothetical protein [bacterium]